MHVPEWVRRFDNALIGLVREYSVTILRIGLGVVFVWFGALKIFGISPAADLVSKTLYFLPPHIAVVGLGVIEIVVGAGLLTGLAIRLILLVFLAQMIGTFFTLVVRPDLAFEGGNPLRLTTIGEFIVKNFVLISAGLVILGTVRKARSEEGVPEILGQKAETAPTRN